MSQSNEKESDKSKDKGGAGKRNSAKQSVRGFERQDALRQSLSRSAPPSRETDGPDADNPGDSTDRAPEVGAQPADKPRSGTMPTAESGAGKGGRRRVSGTRMTVDLSADQHAFLKRYVARSGSDGMRVVRALLRRLEEDEELSRAIMEDLIEERVREASGD